jgi:hypothetical protein
LEGARVRLISGSLFDAYTNSSGFYWIGPVSPGLGDFEASKEGYDSTSVVQYNILPKNNVIDFTLLRGPYSCEPDCTTVGSNVCRAECAGVNGCPVQPEVNEFCDGRVSGFVYDYPDGKEVVCCTGTPYTPVKATFQVDSDNVLRIARPVLYQGRFVNLILDIFD